MEIFYLLVIVALFLWLRNTLSAGLKDLAKEVKKLREEIQQRPGKVSEEYQRPQAPVSPVAAPPVITQPAPPPPPAPEEVFEESQSISIAAPSPPPRPQPVFEKKQHSPPPPKPTFFERHPDLEKFIGENLINKIGIGILVLGIAFFVKYAIDKEWINEIGRVGIGILAGGLLIGIAHRLRKTFKAFSSVLVGGGLSVLYFTIAIAFHQYHIFGQTPAFIIMVVITGFAVALSIAYNRIELAVLALIGGFTTPFLVSTGEGNYKVLFSYLLILNIGMLVLAYRKKWNLVNILSYIFTVILYGSWLLFKCLDMPGAPYTGALLFGTAFYVVFFLMNIIYNIRNNIRFLSFEIGMLLSNTALFFAAGMAILFYQYSGSYQGMFTLLMGIFNFGFAFALYKKQTVDRNLIFLLIGLVLTFISLAAPIQLEGNHITLFWAAEAVLLLWFSQKSGIKLVKITSMLVSALMILSLVMDWNKIYENDLPPVLTLFLNKAFLTAVVTLASVFLSLKLLNKEKEEFFAFRIFPLSAYQSILRILFAVLLYFTFSLEFRYQLSHAFDTHYALAIGLGIYNFSFLVLAFAFVRNRLTQPLSIVFTITSALCLLTYFVEYNFSIIRSRADFLEGSNNGLFFKLHILLAILFALGIFVFNQSTKKWMGKGNADWIKWITVFLVVYISSAELNHLATWVSYSPGRIIYYLNRQVAKAGYSVLWGLISFILMQQGMKRKDRVMRIISLSLFFITILKLFFWDIRGISEAGKIIAFISLGVILLVVSFMYQRLKRLILENDITASPAKMKLDPDGTE